MMNAAPVPKVTKKVAKKDAVVVEPVVAAAPAPAPAAAPAKAVKKSAKAEAAAATTAAPVVVAPVSAPAAEAPAAAATAPATTLDEDIKTVTTHLSMMRETVASLMGQIKRLEKRVHREIKDARKRKRRVKTDENGVEVKRAPSIFERPTQISEELCHFLGKSKGTQMSRSEVTKAVNNYVKEKGLKNKHDIKPDASLKKLLGVPEGEQLTYFNLQRYLNKHYIKTAPVATA
jgi:chromatin remodeling complex protein RSC6